MDTVIRKTELAVWSILLLGIWMLAHPYRGIFGDGLLYAVQSLHWLYPANFSHDPFFISGSQDGYTLFSPLYGSLIWLLGLDHASLLLMLASVAMWLYGLWKLTQLFKLKGELLLISLLVVLLSSGDYGSDGVFAIGESTVTPRILAEALSMVAITYCMEKRFGLAWLIMAIASALHPLMALPIAATVLIMMSGNYFRAAWVAGSLTALVFALSFQPAGPFHLLRETMPPDWLALARDRSPFVFPDLWHAKDFSQLCLDAVILWLGYRFLSHRLSGLALALLVVLSVFDLAAYLGASVFHNALIVGLQLWRAQWIAHLAAMLMLFPLCAGLWRMGYWERALAIGVGCSWIAIDTVAGPMALLVAGAYSLIKRYWPDYLPSRLIHWILLLIPVQTLLWKLAILFPSLVIDAGYSFRPIWIEALTYPVVSMGIYVVIRKLLLAASPPKNIFVTAGVAWLIPALLGFCFWDIREPERIYDTADRQAAIAPVKAAIPDRSLVYWENGVDQAWLLLNRSNFSSAVQTAGSVFSRKNALLLAYRTSLLKQTGFKDNTQIWKDKNRTYDDKLKTLKDGALETLCGDSNLDFVITRKTTNSLPILNFLDPGKGKRYNLYSCKRLIALKNGVTKADRRS